MEPQATTKPKYKFKSKKFAGTEDYAPQTKEEARAAKPAAPAKKAKPVAKKAKVEKTKAKVEAKTTTPKTPRKAKGPSADETVAHIPEPTVKLKTNTAPSVEIATELQTAFDHFNSRLFEGKLEPVIFSNCRLKKAKGYFWAKQWARRKDLKGLVHEIGLDFAKLHGENDKEVLSTLVHEMVHLLVEQLGKSPKKSYHCKFWVAGMHKVGLEPVILSSKGQPLDKATGPNATHTIPAGGAYDEAFKALAATGFKLSWASQPVVEPEKKEGKKKKAGAKAKHACPTCNANAWGKPSMVITCKGTTDDPHDAQEMECDRAAYEGGEGGEDEGQED